VLLEAWSGGDEQAFDRLVPLIYDDLRRLAAWARRHEAPHDTVQTTALVHEAYIRLAGQRHATFKNRGHFFAVAATAMRRLLVDDARRRKADKRGAGQPKVPLDVALEASARQDDQILEVNDALQALRERDPDLARLVELRYFVGLSVEETAEILGVSRATVGRDWATARAFLLRELDRR
jgi:RNA polymerase sigma factor (TIGR02999 family)